MTDVSLIHAFNILAGTIDDKANGLQEWQKKALMAKKEECHQIIASKDRRAFTNRRESNGQ